MINKTASILTKLAAPTIALAVFSSLPAHAGTVYNATFLSIADNTLFSNPYVDNVSFGDPFKVVIALDNGGSSILNQTWTASNVISVTFDFGNGAHKTVFDPNGGNGFNSSIGSFATNGSGQLTAVPSSWTDSSQVNVISTNSTQTPNAWFLNDLNDK